MSMKVQIKRVSTNHYRDIQQVVTTKTKHEVIVKPNVQETKLQIDRIVDLADIYSLVSINETIRIRIARPFTGKKETLTIDYDFFKKHGLKMVETVIRDFIMTIGTESYGRDIVKWGTVGMKQRTKYDIWLENGTL